MKLNRIAQKTGGLFNLSEMAKAKEKRQLINNILGFYRQNCADQNIGSYMFESEWNTKLESKTIRELKKELKLLTDTRNMITDRNCKCFPGSKCDSIGECGR